jgi:DNA-binding MarR family transcriptional regulator
MNYNKNEEVNENYIVSSLVRGLRILSTFTTKRPSLKVSEIAEINGLDQATVFRFVYTLEKLGYLVATKKPSDTTKCTHAYNPPARSRRTRYAQRLPCQSCRLSKSINKQSGLRF